MREITTWLPGILMAYTAFLMAIASPGPNVLAVIGTSMSIGRSSGTALAAGVAAGSCAWAILTAAGLTALLATWAPMLTAIKVFGGFYLLWLGYKALRSAASPHEIEAKALAVGPSSLTGYVLRGFTIQMSNPKAVLAWIAIVSLGFQDGAPVWVAIVIVLGTTLLSVTIHILYAVAFSTPAMIRAYSKAHRSIQITLGVFFGVAGAKLLLNEL